MKQTKCSPPLRRVKCALPRNQGPHEGLGPGGVLHGVHLIGIEDPLLLHHKGVVFRDRNTRGGPLFRELDAHGHALSLYFGAGHGRFALHNELEALSHRFALLVGLKAFRQPADVFTSAIRKSRGTGSMVTCARRRRRTGAESSLTSLSGGSTFLAGELAS